MKPEDGPSGGRVAEAPEGPSTDHVSASELRATLRTALAGRSAEARSAFLDGVVLALELGPEQIVAALESVDVDAKKSVSRRRTGVSNAIVNELLAHAETALPPKREPRSTTIDSRDMPPPIAAPWIDRKPWNFWIDSASFADDDPEALRASGPQAVAAALAGLAEWGAACGRKDVREVAALLREWLIGDAGRFDTLDRDLGLSPRDGRRPLSDIAKRAARDAMVIGLSRERPYAGMGARKAAQALRAACEAYETRRWSTDRAERETRPQGENGVWWQVMKLGLTYTMPGEERLKTLIERDRGRAN